MRNIARMWSLCVLTGLTFALTVAYLMLLFSSSAISQGGREVPGARFEFALIGDMPYDARQEKEFANVMREIDAAELAFVVHDGDFWFEEIVVREAKRLPLRTSYSFARRAWLEITSQRFLHLRRNLSH